MSSKKVSIWWRNSGLSAILVPVLLSLFCERRRKKEGRGARERSTERRRGRRIQSVRLVECHLFAEEAEESKCLPVFLLRLRGVGCRKRVEARVDGGEWHGLMVVL